MKTTYLTLIGIVCLVIRAGPASAADDQVVTVISADTLAATIASAPVDSVSDQPVRHVESSDGRLGIGIVHRPVLAANAVVTGIQHHRQSEVYRVMSGSGTLVTSSTMSESTPIDPDGFIVTNLTGPSDRGVIRVAENSQLIAEGDVVIIPAGVAHGFSEITDAITYMVVRIDPDRLVTLK